MSKYKIYIGNDFKGIYNCKELEKNFSIKRHEIYSFLKNKPTQKFIDKEIILKKV